MSKRAVGWFTGVLVVLGAVEAVAINNVNAGWGWDVGASAAVLVLAILSGWFASRNSDGPTAPPPREPQASLGPGAVLVSGKVRDVQTIVRGARSWGKQLSKLGPGAVWVSRTGRARNITTKAEDAQSGDGTPP